MGGKKRNKEVFRSHQSSFLCSAGGKPGAGHRYSLLSLSSSLAAASGGKAGDGGCEKANPASSPSWEQKAWATSPRGARRAPCPNATGTKETPRCRLCPLRRGWKRLVQRGRAVPRRCPALMGSAGPCPVNELAVPPLASAAWIQPTPLALEIHQGLCSWKTEARRKLWNADGEPGPPVLLAGVLSPQKAPGSSLPVPPLPPSPCPERVPSQGLPCLAWVILRGFSAPGPASLRGCRRSRCGQARSPQTLPPASCQRRPEQRRVPWPRLPPRRRPSAPRLSAPSTGGSSRSSGDAGAPHAAPSAHG